MSANNAPKASAERPIASAPQAPKNEPAAPIAAQLQLTTIRRRLARIRSVGALLALVAAGPAQAYNEGGTLLVHFNPSLTYTSDVSNYVGLSGVSCSDDLAGGCPPYNGTCYYGNDTQPTSSRGVGQAEVAFVMAAFPPGTCVRLAGAAFGIQYDDSHLVLTDWGQAGSFELATANWPNSGEGTAVTFAGAVGTAPVQELYWFACYAYAPTTLRLIDHPTQGAMVADDATPSAIRPIVGFGVGGLAGADGYRPDDPTPAETSTWGMVKARYRFSTNH